MTQLFRSLSALSTAFQSASSPMHRQIDRSQVGTLANQEQWQAKGVQVSSLILAHLNNLPYLVEELTLE